MKKIILLGLLTILINTFFLVWNFSGKFQDGDFGMQPFQLIINTTLTFLLVSLTINLIKLDLDSYMFFAWHFIISQLSYLFLGWFLNGYFEVGSLPLVHILKSNIAGFVSRGIYSSQFLSYIVIYLFVKLIK